MQRKRESEPGSGLIPVHRTTVIGIIRDGWAAIAGDGQVTFGQTILKHSAKKVRALYNNQVLAGFAGSVADALALFERMEEKLESSGGNLPKASVELARDWRSDRVLRRLDAVLAVLNREKAFIITGQGDIIEPEDKIVAIGSGGPYAAAAAKVLLRYTNLTAPEICKEALKIASEICVYTNTQITLLELPPEGKK
jgi:ATP-dependent HslUV protease subunit HslV